MICKKSLQKKDNRNELVGPVLIDAFNGARLVTFVEPKHAISEQFRTLRTNIEFAGAALDKLQVLMFTSAEMSDGKITVSSNVAVAWAQAGKSVLYVDADLRRPTAHSTFDLLNTRGLTTILANNDQPKDTVQKNLWTI